MDLDGVIYKWAETARFLLNLHFGYKLGVSTHWDYIKNHVSPRHWKWLWGAGVEEHGLFRHGDCYPGSFEALDQIADAHSIVILTVRPPGATRDTLDWIAFHGIRAREIHLLQSGAKKSSIPCDIYVDDSLDNVVALTAAGKRALLWDRPWNRTERRGPWTRVRTWKEVFSRIRLTKPGLKSDSI
jgi:uncharacterized HAD superfamily protein